jgi:superfamily I DNA/RNA helicase/RecB family exonuclease
VPCTRCAADPFLSDPRGPIRGVGEQTPYRLRRRAVPPMAAPALDAVQQAVVDHRSGPLLVLAGPGTGKTTTLVECVARRVEAGLAPETVLVLTFSRKAASELRERISARLGLTTSGASAWTFHAFCYALLRAHTDDLAYERPLRLLAGPEQDVAVHELLTGHADGEGRGRWPQELRAGLRTRGFAAEVRAVLARARELGLEPVDLAERARRAGRADWAAVAAFHEEYLDVLGDLGAVDHSELVHAAGLLLRRPDVLAGLRERYAAVLVDEYQDTDPSQEALLAAIAGDGRDLVVVGDPDQSIYAFRGADVGALLRFPERFPTREGAPAPVRVLGTSRRAGTALLAASREVTRRLPLSGLPTDAVRAHRALEPAPGTSPGGVEVETHPSAGAEVEAIADRLRRAHLEGGVPWSRMAVLVRSGVRSIPLLRRVLAAAGVPLEVAGDELPLAAEPAVAPLLLALRCVDAPEQLTPDRARALLLSPLGGADASELRRLGRALREEERAASDDEEGMAAPPRPSALLVREAVDPTTPGDPLVGLDPGATGSARGLRRLLQRARAVLVEGGTPEQVLWALWSGTPWPARLAAASAAGGPEGRAADRDLDAVVALFEVAAHAEEQVGHRGVANLLAELEAQAIPGDTLAERGTAGEAVRLLTAHRSKGLEWDVVVVCGVQEGVWPDLRRRGSVLEPDRIGRDGVTDPVERAALLAEERRLFYVAVTRARAELLVTAVDSPEEDGERPSRFLAELGLPVRRVTERVQRPLTLTGLVAELRSTLVDPDAGPALREAAAARLAVLAAATTPDGEPVAPAADPDRWWGVLETTAAPEPLHRPGRPVRLSGTSLSGLGTCPLRWFLDHEVHADVPASTAMGFGGLLHVLADQVARGQTDADLGALERRLDRVWGQLAYEAPWVSTQQREAAREALSRLLAWHLADRGRRLVATEVGFEVPVTVEAPATGGSAEVVLRGSMDRVEVDGDGRVHVADLKTGKTPPSAGEVERHPQLGLYQLAVQAGALDEVEGVGPGACPGGAELVHLRLDGPKKGPAGQPKSQSQPPLDPEQPWVPELLATAVTRLLAEDFPATPNDRCERCPFRRCCPAQPDGQQVVA